MQCSQVFVSREFSVLVHCKKGRIAGQRRVGKSWSVRSLENGSFENLAAYLRTTMTGDKRSCVISLVVSRFGDFRTLQTIQNPRNCILGIVSFYGYQRRTRFLQKAPGDLKGVLPSRLSRGTVQLQKLLRRRLEIPGGLGEVLGDCRDTTLAQGFPLLFDRGANSGLDRDFFWSRRRGGADRSSCQLLKNTRKS